MTDEQSSADTSLSGDAEYAALREQFKSDYSGLDDTDAEPVETQATDKPSTEQSGRAPEPAEAEKQKADDATASDSDKPDNSEASADAGDPQSSYQKRKSERDKLLEDQKRLAKNWQEFSEGKLKWQREQNEKLTRLEQALAQAQRQPQQQVQEARFSSSEFQRASEWYEGEAEKAIVEGDVDKAREMLGKARQTRMAAHQQFAREQQAFQQQAVERFTVEYRANADKVITEHPELNDPKNTVWPKMQELLDKVPVFTQYPEGFRWAYEFARKDMDAAEVSWLREQLKQEREGKKALEERTQLKGGTTPNKPLKTDVDTMDDAEQEEFLKRQFVQSYAEGT